MESMRDVNRVMEREIKKGSSPLKLDHIEFGNYSYQEIMSQEKLFEVLTYLLRIGDFKQYAGKTKSLLCIFATNNSFFTREELATFFSEPEAYDSLNEFVSAYPYLFEILQNRISLIHDSLNTYLRGILSSFPIRQEKVLNIVKSSLIDGNVEYMARLASFNLDDEFLIELLKKFSDFDVFEKILTSTVDFNSITSTALNK